MSNKVLPQMTVLDPGNECLKSLEIRVDDTGVVTFLIVGYELRHTNGTLYKTGSLAVPFASLPSADRTALASIRPSLVAAVKSAEGGF